jgi:hypothetical protein
VIFKTIKLGYGGLNSDFMVRVFTGTARDALRTIKSQLTLMQTFHMHGSFKDGTLMV